MNEDYYHEFSNYLWDLVRDKVQKMRKLIENKLRNLKCKYNPYLCSQVIMIQNLVQEVNDTHKNVMETTERNFGVDITPCFEHYRAKILNQKLSEIGIIYKQSGQWMFKGKYKEWNLGSSRTFNRILPDGRVIANTNLVWNQRGKRFILALYNNNFNVKDAIAEINGEKKSVPKNNQSNF